MKYFPGKMFILISLAAVIAGCVNPFAPKLDEELNSTSMAEADLSSINGVFQNFQNAYAFRDTTVYGRLLAHDFIFSYRDYDLGYDVNWGRDEEMRVSNGLFQNSQRLDLVWNNILAINDDSTNIVRSFNLTITFNPTDIIRVDGRVNLKLRKNKMSDNWEIFCWTDESNF
jgi:hypothetical protein